MASVQAPSLGSVEVNWVDVEGVAGTRRVALLATPFLLQKKRIDIYLGGDPLIPYGGQVSFKVALCGVEHSGSFTAASATQTQRFRELFVQLRGHAKQTAFQVTKLHLNLTRMPVDKLVPQAAAPQAGQAAPRATAKDTPHATRAAPAKNTPQSTPQADQEAAARGAPRAPRAAPAKHAPQAGWAGEAPLARPESGLDDSVSSVEDMTTSSECDDMPALQSLFAVNPWGERPPIVAKDDALDRAERLAAKEAVLDRLIWKCAKFSVTLKNMKQQLAALQ